MVFKDDVEDNDNGYKTVEIELTEKKCLQSYEVYEWVGWR